MAIPRVALQVTLAAVGVAFAPLASRADRTVAGHVDRAAYIRANVAMLRALPLPPHGRILLQRSSPQYTGFDPPGEIKGYMTEQYYTAPKAYRGKRSIDFSCGVSRANGLGEQTLPMRGSIGADARCLSLGLRLSMVPPSQCFSTTRHTRLDAC